MLGASGVQIEALDSQNSAYRPRIREQGLFFRSFCGTEDLFFFFDLHLRIRGKLNDF